MKGTFAIFLREIKAYFTSPIAYVIIGVYMLMMGYFFYSILSYFNVMCAQTANYMASTDSPDMNVNLMVIQPLMLNMAVIILLVMPVLTMRLYAEEKKQGAIELLMTSPLSNFQIVAGKFLGSFAIYTLLILLTVSYQFIIGRFSTPDIAPIVTGYIGMLMLGMSYVALGGWASAMTKDQVIAAVVSFGIFLLLWVVGWGAEFSSGPISKALAYISTMDRLDGFVRGVINTQDVVYFITITLFGLAMTSISIDSIRWKE